MSVRWLAESLDRGVVAARVGRDGDRLVADWTGRARLSVKSDGSDVEFVPNAGADAREVDKLRHGAVKLLLAHLRGSIPLHASAVAIDGRSVVLVGASHLGKSTLAAALCEYAGASLLGDDAVVIERRADRFHVVALDELHWLDGASATALGRDVHGAEKVPLEPRRVDVKSAPADVVLHLEFSDDAGEARFVPVVGLDAIAGLLAQLTRFVVDDPVVAKRDLGTLAELIDRTRVARLVRPRRLDLLRETALAIVAFANGEPS
ncbi:MAG: Serine kinase of the HPr protein regulates carbohydrate metabolism [Labilithrix sp.]|nr:Serine kinase of the HPr protein regulates carbohydrate metabolism [Labilithrix sp.]